jgi:hypothetical protein
LYVTFCDCETKTIASICNKINENDMVTFKCFINRKKKSEVRCHG